MRPCLCDLHPSPSIPSAGIHSCAATAGKLLVNLDKSVPEAVWEARWLRNLGLEVPQAAQAILLQQEKFSLYYQQLAHVLEVRPLSQPPSVSKHEASTKWQHFWSPAGA